MDVSTVSNATCKACGHSIDAAAKLCPYCSANPATGERMDTSAIVQEIFHPREVSTSESVLEFARQRQGIVVVVSLIVGFVILAAIHQFVTARNNSAGSAEAAVPLTEVADVSAAANAATPLPMPELKFQYEGNAKAMRTFIVEHGATTPPEVLAEQQAAQQAAAEKAAAAAAKLAPQQPGAANPAAAPNTAAPRPGQPMMVPPPAERPGQPLPQQPVQQPQRPPR